MGDGAALSGSNGENILSSDALSASEENPDGMSGPTAMPKIDPKSFKDSPHMYDLDITVYSNVVFPKKAIRMATAQGIRMVFTGSESISNGHDPNGQIPKIDQNTEIPKSHISEMVVDVPPLMVGHPIPKYDLAPCYGPEGFVTRHLINFAPGLYDIYLKPQEMGRAFSSALRAPTARDVYRSIIKTLEKDYNIPRRVAIQFAMRSDSVNDALKNLRHASYHIINRSHPEIISNDMRSVPVLMPVWKKGDKRTKDQRDHQDAGHYPREPDCDACQRALMRDKPARRGTAPRDRDCVTVSMDGMDHTDEDNNHHRYTFGLCVHATSYPLVINTREKNAATIARVFHKMKAFLEMISDPGNRTEYRIERLITDPGTEFQGKMKEYLEESKIEHLQGQVDHHTSNSLSENMNMHLQRYATVMGIQAFGDDETSQLVWGELIRHAAFLRQHNSITTTQKEAGITARQEQTGKFEAFDFSQLNTFGEKAYVYVKKKSRKGKVSQRAIRCFWVGVQEGCIDPIMGAHRFIPYTKKGGHIQLYPTITAITFRIFRGEFPLHEENLEKDDPDESAELMDEAETLAWVKENVPEDACGGDHYVETILDHFIHSSGDIDYYVKWQDYDDSHNLWLPAESVDECAALKVYFKSHPKLKAMHDAACDPTPEAPVVKKKRKAKAKSSKKVSGMVEAMPMCAMVEREVPYVVRKFIREQLPDDFIMAISHHPMTTLLDDHVRGDRKARVNFKFIKDKLRMECGLSKRITEELLLRATTLKQALGMMDEAYLTVADLHKLHTASLMRVPGTATPRDQKLNGYPHLKGVDNGRWDNPNGGVGMDSRQATSNISEVNAPTIADAFMSSMPCEECDTADDTDLAMDQPLFCFQNWELHLDEVGAPYYEFECDIVRKPKYGDGEIPMPPNAMEDGDWEYVMDDGTSNVMVCTDESVITMAMESMKKKREDARERRRKFHSDEFAQLSCAANELTRDECFRPDQRERTRAAIEKETQQMLKRRLTLLPEPTPEQKRSAIPARYVITDKRQELHEIRDNKPGRRKARLVAQDLKIFHKEDAADVYAPTPSFDAFRFIIAVFNPEYDCASSTDFDVAYLQSDGKKPYVLAVKDKETGKITYYLCEGEIYGCQTAGAAWRETLRKYLISIGFKEVENVMSVYYHAERNIIICNHVDDPFIVCRGESKEVSKANEEWVHNMLEKRFDTKGRHMLTPEDPIDYLSMRISINDKHQVFIDNAEKIKKYLELEGLENVNPAQYPLDKVILQEMEDCDEYMTGAEQTQFRAHVGKFRWLCDTTHPMISCATSMLASYCNKPPKAAAKAVRQVYRFLRYTMDFALTHTKARGAGLYAESDADWAGYYAINGDPRSRTGSALFYDDFLFAWRSAFQNCRASGYIEDAMIAISTGESEEYAMAETLKMLLHSSYYADEVGVKVKKPLVIGTDSTAAIGFTANVGKVGRMRHIDVRQAWVRQLRDRELITPIKVPGVENRADGFTKLLSKLLMIKWINSLGVRFTFGRGGHEKYD